jgi:hypothetical protein
MVAAQRVAIIRPPSTLNSSPFAIQLKLLPQLRDDGASRFDLLDRQVLGTAVGPRRLHAAGLTDDGELAPTCDGRAFRANFAVSSTHG